MIYKYIKNLLGYSKQTNNKDYVNPNTDNQLIMSCDQDGIVKVKITINHVGKNASINFGNMLFLMNEGYYVQSICDIFQEIKDSNTDHTKFIEDITNTWAMCVLQIEKLEAEEENSPIVSPTFFDKGSKHQ
jgi:hypothetical protein